MNELHFDKQEPLKASNVREIFQEMLKRNPSEADLKHHLSNIGTVEELVELVKTSEEYAVRHSQLTGEKSKTPAVSRVNIWHEELAEWGHITGTQSTDGVAIVGHEGWLFLLGGSNKNLPQFTGEVPMEDDWLPAWIELSERRHEDIVKRGYQLVSIVVPEKLAVYEDRYPEKLRRVAPRPIERLQNEAGLSFIYPIQELQAKKPQQQVYLRTDTHLTLYGNYLMHVPLVSELGCEPLSYGELGSSHKYLITGDLGSRFEPQIVEIAETIGTLGKARIVEDNHKAIAAVGGHVGTKRVFENNHAPDPRTVVVFGDSYAFAATATQGLSWFLAQIFRNVHFLWAPFGWDAGYAESAKADIVICQMAERFVGRVPLHCVDVQSLAKTTLEASFAPDFGDIFETDQQ